MKIKPIKKYNIENTVYSKPPLLNYKLDVVEGIGLSMSDNVKQILKSLEGLKLDPVPNNIAKNFSSVSFVSENLSNSVRRNLLELESIKELVKAVKIDTFKYLNNCNNLIYFRNSLNKKSIKELIILYLQESDFDKSRFIWNLIIQKEKIKKYNDLLKKINKRLKKIISYFILYAQRNLRLYIRKIQSFHFKNLDDYHNITIIKKVQFEDIQPLVLILSNSNNEKKYFR